MCTKFHTGNAMFITKMKKKALMLAPSNLESEAERGGVETRAELKGTN